jgi:hypothetical protein
MSLRVTKKFPLFEKKAKKYDYLNWFVNFFYRTIIPIFIVVLFYVAPLKHWSFYLIGVLTIVFFSSLNYSYVEE